MPTEDPTRKDRRDDPQDGAEAREPGDAIDPADLEDAAGGTAPNIRVRVQDYDLSSDEAK